MKQFFLIQLIMRYYFFIIVIAYINATRDSQHFLFRRFIFFIRHPHAIVVFFIFNPHTIFFSSNVVDTYIFSWRCHTIVVENLCCFCIVSHDTSEGKKCARLIFFCFGGLSSMIRWYWQCKRRLRSFFGDSFMILQFYQLFCNFFL